IKDRDCLDSTETRIRVPSHHGQLPRCLLLGGENSGIIIIEI
ncbi:MAG: hypothetical protein UV82_C0019G0002, partial [Candidatus Magasanikbacteria bacterium GW2011_GWD2_43_18]